MSETRDEDLPEDDVVSKDAAEEAEAEEAAVEAASDDDADEPDSEDGDEEATEAEAASDEDDASADAGEAAEAMATRDDAPPSPAESGPRRGVPLWERLAYERPPLWYRVAQLLLPPLLAAGAVGVHWWLNVPDKILESPKDQGANKKKRARASKPRARRGNSRGSREQPRSAAVLANDWRIFASEPFDDEPVRSVWARRHQALINRAMVVARREGFEGAPEPPNVVLASTKCRTVRCRFVMRSPFAHELDVMSRALQRIEIEGETVWRSFETAPAAIPEGMPTSDHYLQVTVGFTSDETDSRLLALGPLEGEEPTPDEDDEGEEEGEAGGELEDED